MRRTLSSRVQRPHDDRRVASRQQSLDEGSLATAIWPLHINQCALDHGLTYCARTARTNPPGPSAAMICRIRSRTWGTLPFCSAAAMVLEYAAKTSEPVTS